MPKPSNFPPLYDSCQTLNIAVLKRGGCLIPNQRAAGIITWHKNKNETGCISFAINTGSKKPYIKLDYSYQKARINYVIQLVSIPSNLGKGVVWYFVCPHTNKRCRKLYLIDTYFYHRTAFKGCYYEKQIQSKAIRSFENSDMAKDFIRERYYEKIYSKHFKKQYKGKPTKQFLKLLKRIEV